MKDICQTELALASPGGSLVGLHISFIPVGNVHSLYVSANAVTGWDQSDRDGWLPGISFGYQFQSEANFFARISISTVGLFPVPGVALGGSF